MSTTENRRRIQFMTRFAILLAIEAIFCFTPLGSLPSVGMLVATLAMIPVIVTGVVMGPKAGTLMGLCAGIFSLIIWTFAPPTPPLAFVFSPFYSLGEAQGNFWSLVICLVPRTLVGTVAGLLASVAQRRSGSQKGAWLGYGLSGLLASLVNTIGVLGGIYLFFGPAYFASLQSFPDFAFETLMAYLLFLTATNGLPEAVLGFVVAAFAGPLLKKALQRNPLA